MSPFHLGLEPLEGRILFSVDPRLFVTPERLTEIRAAIQVPGTTHQEAYDAMKARVDQNDWHIYDETPGDGNWAYPRVYLAREASMMYLITEQPGYAQQAYDALELIYTDTDPDERTLTTSYGLSRATVGMGFALADDWCRDAWSEAQRTWISDQLQHALDVWEGFYHPNFTWPYGSNWVAVCRGGELVMMLSAGEEDARSGRYEDLKGWLEGHMEHGYGPEGFSQEGMGYVAYGGLFLLPAVYALQSVGDTSLNAEFQSHAWWRHAAYGMSFTESRDVLQYGVSHRGVGDQGWNSLLLNSVEGSQLAHYQYIYDHQMGIDAPNSPSEKYDWRRAGTVWTLLYYPDSAAPTDPGGALPASLADPEKGGYFFRDRWQDRDDVQVSFMADTDHHDHAWDQAEAFQLGLLAHDTRWIGGPGKDREPRDYSALLVDGRSHDSSADTGTAEFFRADDHGGYVIAGGGQKYAALGLDSAERHLLVDFESGDPWAWLATVDRAQDGAAHTYTWQLNLGDEQGDGGLTVSTGSESGRPTFTVSNGRDAYLKGWVLTPAGATVVGGDPLQVTTTAADADIWVAMTVGTGAPPTGVVTGSGLDSVLRVGDAAVMWDPAASPASLKRVPFGDANADGQVDDADWQAARRHWAPFASGCTWGEGDFEGDGAVGNTDLADILANWGASPTSAEGEPRIQAVPPGASRTREHQAGGTAGTSSDAEAPAAAALLAGAAVESRRARAPRLARETSAPPARPSRANRAVEWTAERPASPVQGQAVPPADARPVAPAREVVGPAGRAHADARVDVLALLSSRLGRALPAEA